VQVGSLLWKGKVMAWLTLSEALEALQQRLQAHEGFSPAQRVLIVDIVEKWRQELRTQERAPGERRKCAVCGNMVPPTYVLDSAKHPTHIMCPLCWFGDLGPNDLIMVFDRIIHDRLNDLFRYTTEESAILLQEINEQQLREENRDA
jgi:hypothetical protein